MARETKGWAVYTPRGRCLLPTVRDAAWKSKVFAAAEIFKGFGWVTAVLRKGYTCRRVTVTAEGDDG